MPQGKECNMRVLVAVIVSCLVGTQPAMAAGVDDAQAVVKKSLNSVTNILKQNLDKNIKEQRIVSAVTPVFDLPLMARLTLGKKHWGRLSVGQRQKYSDLYIKHLQKTYLGQLNLYSNEKIVYKKPVEKKGKVYVPTELVSESQTTPVLYKLYRAKDGRWKIWDVEVSGASVVYSKRAEFDAILSKGTIEDLYGKLNATLQ